jgi:putative transposase
MYNKGMSYDLIMKKRVIAYVERGGSKADAARIFGISRGVIYRWLALGDDLVPKKPGRVRGVGYRLDWLALHARIKETPDLTLRELAQEFDVGINTIWHALKRTGLSRKKNDGVRGGEAL